MYRVLAARSLKFLEQREEDTVSYQRQFKAAARVGSGKRGISPNRREESKEAAGFGSDSEDYPSRIKHTASGGNFHISYLEKSPGNHGALVRQTGDKAAVAPPLLGHPPKKEGGDDGEKDSNSPRFSSSHKQHATILVHDRKDRGDQLNLRIKTHMEQHRLQTHILVDEVVQKRLRKKHTKQMAISQSLTKLRGQKGPPSSTLMREAHGAGVWSQLGQHYQEHGPADLDLPQLNVGVPLRELTRSRQPRQPPHKESSEHRKKYEHLVELFREQRNRVMQPPLRDGQDGAPRHTGSGSTAAQKPMGSPSHHSFGLTSQPLFAWEAGGSLSADTGSEQGGVNAANQSLLARLYQTQNQGRFAGRSSGSETAADKADGESGGGDGASHEGRKLSTSASTGVLRSSKHSTGAVSSGDVHQTSVDRIAALQPRKFTLQSHPSLQGWDAYSVRPLASSASVPNFDRRHLSSPQSHHHHVPRSQHPLAIAALPEGHAALTHQGLLPNPTAPLAARQIVQEAAEKEARDRGVYGAMELAKARAAGQALPEHFKQRPASGPMASAGAASNANLSSGSAAARGSRGQSHSPTRLPFSPLRRTLPTPNKTLFLSPDHPDHVKRRQNIAALAKDKARRRKIKEESEKEIYEEIMKQLGESRLDHLHRWRNAFDGTKQRMDRLLIKRLVSRAEVRAEALQGGLTTLEPHIQHVLSEQEIAQLAADERHSTRHSAIHSAAAPHTRRSLDPLSGERDALHADDFSALGYHGDGFDAVPELSARSGAEEHSTARLRAMLHSSSLPTPSPHAAPTSPFSRYEQPQRVPNKSGEQQQGQPNALEITQPAQPSP